MDRGARRWAGEGRFDGVDEVGRWPRSRGGYLALAEGEELGDQPALCVIANWIDPLAVRLVGRAAGCLFQIQPPSIFAIRPDRDAMETDRAKRGVPFSLGG